MMGAGMAILFQKMLMPETARQENRRVCNGLLCAGMSLSAHSASDMLGICQ